MGGKGEGVREVVVGSALEVVCWRFEREAESVGHDW